MSGFCVFGITKAICKKIAESKVKMVDHKEKRLLTIDEWRESVNLLSEKLFLSGEIKERQISPAFDAPHFAEEWKEVGLKSGFIARPKIMVRSQKKDKKTGAVVLNKKGVPVICWAPYNS